jgi:RNA polymerase sigma-70 factor (ECF subfamily)
MREYHSYDNKTLLGLMSKSNELAFTELYNRFWQKLFGIAYNRLQDTQLAEDIVHDVFASLWNNRKKVDIDSLENYLASATKYLVLATIKRKERERLYNNQSFNSPVIELSIEFSLHYKRILEKVNKEVEKLPERCRLIFKYSRNNGMPIQSIAKELHISPKTVENQLNKALKQLRTSIKTFYSFLFFLISVINFFIS